MIMLAFVLLLFFLVSTLGTGGRGSPRHHAGDPLSRYFHLLRRTPSSLPSWAIPQVPTSYEADWHSARALPLKHQKAWVVQAKAGLCLVIRDPSKALGVVCAARRDVLQHGLFVTSLQDPSTGTREVHREIIGVVPDYAKVARLITPGYGTAQPKLVRGVFQYHDDIPASPQYAVLIRR